MIIFIFWLYIKECSASQVLDPFPVVSPEIVVREARVEDWWEVAETRYTAPSSLDIRSRLILSSELIGRWQWLSSKDEIAYISSVAFRESFTRKGIAKRLIWAAEALDKNWQCRAIGLHCDLLNNLGATKLYKDQGYRCIRIPEGANWPQPKTSPDTRFKTSWWSSWTTTVHKSLNSFGKSNAKGKVEFYLLMK